MRPFQAVARLSAFGLVLGIALQSSGQEYCPITGARIGLSSGSPDQGLFSPSSPAPPNNVLPSGTAPRSVISPPKNSLPPNQHSNPLAGQRLVGPTGRTEGVVPGSTPNPAGNVSPPKNSLPAKSPAQTPAQKQTPKNAPLARSVVHLTPADIKEMHKQLQAQQSRHLNNLRKLIDREIREGHNSEAALQALNRVADHIKTGQATGKDFADLIKSIKKSIAQGTAERNALKEVARMAVNQQIDDWLKGTPVGAAPTGAAVAKTNGAGPNPASGSGVPIPAGGVIRNPGAGTGQNARRVAGVSDPGIGPLGMNNAAGGAGPWAGGGRWGGAGRWGGQFVPLGLIPGLPAGLIIPLVGDFGGTILVGMGQPGDQILLGAGDPDLAAGLPVAPWNAVPALASTGPVADGDIILADAADAAVSYTINQTPYTMQPGDEQTLAAGNSWLVEFDRGNGNGLARYQLRRGYYRFRLGETGWELFQKTFSATLENGSGLPPFSYVIYDQTQTLPAGQVQEITGDYPPVIQFEDGSGQIKQRRLDGPAYRVALGSDRTLDVFPLDAFQSNPSTQTGQVVANNDDDIPPPTPKDLDNPGDATPSGPSVTIDPPTMSLPQGFNLFNPVEALTNLEVAQGLPPAFSLFKATATAMQEDDEKIQ